MTLGEGVYNASLILVLTSWIDGDKQIPENLNLVEKVNRIENFKCFENKETLNLTHGMVTTTKFYLSYGCYSLLVKMHMNKFLYP